MTDYEELLKKIKSFNDTIWDNKVRQTQIENWLANFDCAANGTPDERKLHALYLLSQFMYFGIREIRELTRVMFRDHFRYPIIEQIRETNGHTTDLNLINRKFTDALKRTLFLGVGNPSESGSHLLYFFRQENQLPANRFIDINEISKKPDVDRYVFIDDFCGSGHQASLYLKKKVESIKAIDTKIEVFYFVLCGTQLGMNMVRKNTNFDVVRCVLELDDSFRCFSCSSRYFPSPGQTNIFANFAEDMCRRYGSALEPDAPLGYDNCQLLLGFQHNTPDNSLPIFWKESSANMQWTPIFKRYEKIYG